MDFIKEQFSRFKAFRKAHFSLFVIIDQILAMAVMALMLFVTKVDEIGTSVDKGEVVTSSYYRFAYLDVTKFVWLLPLLASAFCFLYSLVIFTIKYGLKKITASRNASKPFLALTILAFFVGAVILTVFSKQRYVEGINTYAYNHNVALSVTLVLQTFLVLDAYNWREDLGLESMKKNDIPRL